MTTGSTLALIQRAKAVQNGSRAASDTYFGLTKRETMAMHIAAGMYARESNNGYEWVAERSVEAATALLVALEK